MTTRVPLLPAAAPPSDAALDSLHAHIDALERTSGVHAIAVAVYDTETGVSFRRHADRWLHAASTIKVAILLGVYASIHRGWLLKSPNGKSKNSNDTESRPFALP